MKAQSAIEYLVTYGWMLIAVSVVSGVVYSTVQPQCQTDVTGFHSNQLSVSDEGITQDNLFAIVMESQSSERITIDRITLETEETTINRDREVVLDPGEPQLYEIAEIEQDDTSCITADFTIEYALGSLTGQQAVGTAQIPATLIEAIENFLSVGGGQIETLQINSSIMVSPEAQDGSICIGSGCTPIRLSDDTPIEREGDTMGGSLETNNLEVDCIGNQCTHEVGTAEGRVSNINSSMDGTLNATEIRPITNMCIGSLEQCQ